MCARVQVCVVMDFVTWRQVKFNRRIHLQPLFTDNTIKMKIETLRKGYLSIFKSSYLFVCLWQSNSALLQMFKIQILLDALLEAAPGTRFQAGFRGCNSGKPQVPQCACCGLSRDHLYSLNLFVKTAATFTCLFTVFDKGLW